MFDTILNTPLSLKIITEINIIEMSWQISLASSVKEYLFKVKSKDIRTPSMNVVLMFLLLTLSKYLVFLLSIFKYIVIMY